MTEKDTSAIIDKIMKLMTMAERGTTHEREIAYFKAQALMAKYHIEHDELFPKDSEKVIEVVVRLNVKTLAYMHLASIIASNFRCKLFTRYFNKKYIMPVFFGLEVDAKIASEIFKDAYQFAKHESNRIASYYHYHKGSSIGVKGDWLYGFISGLNEGFNKQTATSTETALMVIVPKKVLDVFATLKFGNDKISFNRLKGNNNASIINAGFQKGLHFSNQKQQSVLEDESCHDFDV